MRARRAALVRPVVADAVGGLRRNGLMVAAAITTIAIALTVAGAGWLTSANVAHVAAILEGQVEVVGFLRRDLGAAQQQRLRGSVEGLSGVRSAEIVTRAEALRRLQRTFRSMASINELLPSNPLPDSIEVRVADAREVKAVAEALRRLPGVDEVAYGGTVVERLVAFTRAVRLGGVAVAGLLAAAALLIIVNTIRLTIAARRQEIEIMTLVGATRGFVRGPFVVEGVLQGGTAALIASVLLATGYIVLARQAATALPFLPLLSPAEVLPTTLVVVWVLGLTVGIAGSEIGLRRHLQS
ncbi:MAG: permease-like cell division protein FtsX [Armatimonadota bacterium]|nr:permease-like cell division protein FtsX [Armatimonadota bacterium]